MNDKQIALITGANKGIGLETARQLGKQGITVLVGARDESKGKSAAEELRKEGIDAHGIVIDVNSSDSIKKAAALVEREHGRLDILVNNAGVMLHDEDKSAGSQPLEVWRKTFETNVFGLVATTSADAARKIAKRKADEGSLHGVGRNGVRESVHAVSLGNVQSDDVIVIGSRSLRSSADPLVFWFLLGRHVGALPLSSPRTPAAASGAGFGGAEPPSHLFAPLQAYSLGVR